MKTRLILLWALVMVPFIFIGQTPIQGKPLPVPQMGAVARPLSPIRLVSGVNEIELTDYYTKPDLIKTVTLDGKPVTKKGDKLFINAPILNTIAVLELNLGSEVIAIPVFNAETKKVVLTYKATSNKVTKVELASSLNGWNRKASPMVKGKNGEWSIEFVVADGEYPYRIWEDDVEGMDVNNKLTRDNGLGGKNNVWVVGQPNVQSGKIRTGFVEGNSVHVQVDGNVEELVAFYNNELIYRAQVKDQKAVIPILKNQDGWLRVFGHGNGKRTNDLLVPVLKGSPLLSARSLPRQDAHAQIMYFMMVDRFVDGKKDNNFPTNDPDIQPKANTMGGDLVGITQTVDKNYFRQLGVNTLWISPICQNVEGAWGLWDKGTRSKFSAYHGYWPLALTKVDRRFGTSAELDSLIDHVHDRDMNIIVDYVAHHVHQDHPLIKGKKGWTTPLYLPDGTMNTEKWDEHRLTTWFDTFLPTFDFSNPIVVNAMTDTAMFWLKNYEIDGFRHDATKHINNEFWRTLTYKTKTQFPNRSLYQIGETYGSPELIQSYIGSGMLDAQFDFNLYDAMVDAFAKETTTFENLEKVTKESLRYYGSHHLMGNITGNQDRARFISYADGSVAFDEDAKLAGWSRDIQNKGSSGFRKMEQLMAFIMTTPGVPCIYYGDEIGMPGGNDPDNRRMMTFDQLNVDQRKLKASVSKLTQLRNKNMALIYGDLEFIKNDGQVMAYTRQYFGEIVLVVFDKKDKSHRDSTWIEIPAPGLWQNKFFKGEMGSLWKQENGKWFVLLSGKGYDVFTNVNSREYERLKQKVESKNNRPAKDADSKGEKKEVPAKPEKRKRP
jgi:glycosidase